MEETIAEDAERVDELDKELESTKELDSIERKLDDKVEYDSELSENRYAKSSAYKKSETKSESKKSSGSKERNLEKKVKEAKVREVHDSHDGAHAIIYHIDPETGKIYFAFEKKPADYQPSEYAGTLSLYGGSIKIGESPNDGLARELEEEDPAYKIVIKALNETKWKVAEVPKYADGVPSRTYIWAAEIKDQNEWSKYKSSKSLEGDKSIKSLEEIAGSNFAFGFGPIVKQVGIVLANSKYSNYGYN